MKQISIFLLLFLMGCQTTQLAEQSVAPRNHVEAWGTQYAIATQGNYATKAAAKIFSLGGNIIDATIAASFVVSVERPQSTGIGGGGFMLYHEAKTGKTYAIDFRERAPQKAKANMYLNSSGKPNPLLSQNGILAVAVPGLVAGLLEIHAKFGSLPLATLMEPAIELAKNGFPVYPRLELAMKDREPILIKDPEAAKIFLDPQGHAWTQGHNLVQTDLAHSLELIAKNGYQAFYRGEIAQKIANFSRSQKGLLSKRDLMYYEVKWREPIEGTFDGYQVVSMPPPSSGGIHVIQFLNFLENDHLSQKGFLSAESIHLAASSLQSAFADRAHYLGDPDFVKVPQKELLSRTYSQMRRKEISLDHARHADEVSFGKLPKESFETTHISIIDNKGNAVSTTQTVNGWMGAALVAPGTGILLNNEMDDFAAQVNASNLYGAIGGEPNLIAPGKTPLSSMSPTIILKDGKPVLSVGAPGGTRIISCVAQTILNYIEFKLPLYESVADIRYHHQWKPDVLSIDPPGPSHSVLEKLKTMGYQVELKPVPCNVMAVSQEGNKLHGVADPRDIGTSLAK